METVKINRQGDVGKNLINESYESSLVRLVMNENSLLATLKSDEGYQRRMAEYNKWYRRAWRRIERPFIKMRNIIDLIRQTDEYGNIYGDWD